MQYKSQHLAPLRDLIFSKKKLSFKGCSHSNLQQISAAGWRRFQDGESYALAFPFIHFFFFFFGWSMQWPEVNNSSAFALGHSFSFVAGYMKMCFYKCPQIVSMDDWSMEPIDHLIYHVVNTPFWVRAKTCCFYVRVFSYSRTPFPKQACNFIAQVSETAATTKQRKACLLHVFVCRYYTDLNIIQYAHIQPITLKRKYTESAHFLGLGLCFWYNFGLALFYGLCRPQCRQRVPWPVFAVLKIIMFLSIKMT